MVYLIIGIGIMVWIISYFLDRKDEKNLHEWVKSIGAQEISRSGGEFYYKGDKYEYFIVQEGESESIRKGFCIKAKCTSSVIFKIHMDLLNKKFASGTLNFNLNNQKYFIEGVNNDFFRKYLSQIDVQGTLSRLFEVWEVIQYENQYCCLKKYFFMGNCKIPSKDIIFKSIDDLNMLSQHLPLEGVENPK